VLKLESTHPYPNTSNYQHDIHLKSVSSMVILFDPQCKTVPITTTPHTLCVARLTPRVVKRVCAFMK
jgi:hypothetical protein